MSVMLLTETVTFDTDAEVEILRIAGERGVSKSDLEREIARHLSSVKFGHLGVQRLQVRRSDVISYELATSVYKPQIFYFDPEIVDENNIRAGFVLASDLRATSVDDDIDGMQEEEGEEAQREKDDEEYDQEREEVRRRMRDAGEDYDDYDDGDEEDVGTLEDEVKKRGIPADEARALKQRGAALVSKQVEIDGERTEIPMSPIGRLDHLLPREAIVNKTVRKIFASLGAPIRSVLDAIKDVPDEAAIDTKLMQRSDFPTGAKMIASCSTPLDELTRQLKHDSCLTDREIGVITKSITDAISKITLSSGKTYGSEIQRVKSIIGREFERAVSTALAHRSESSNIIEYLENDPDSYKIASPSDRVRIESRGNVTLADLKSVQDMFEPLLSTENVPKSRRAKEIEQSIKSADEDTRETEEDLGVTLVGIKTKGAALFNDKLSAARIDVHGREAYGHDAPENPIDKLLPAAARTRIDVAGKEEYGHDVSEMLTYDPDIVSQVAQSRGDEEQTTLSTIKTLGRITSKSAHPEPDVTVTEKVRTGETFETLHNFIQDKADLKRDRTELVPYQRRHPYKSDTYYDDPRVRKVRRTRVTKIDFETAVKTAPLTIAKEINSVADRLESAILVPDVLVGDASIEDEKARIKSGSRTKTELRGEIEYLSGLVEYLAMSGADVSLDKNFTSGRERLLGIAKDLRGISLEMTDAIARSRAEMAHTFKTTAEISKKIDDAKKQLDATLRNENEARLRQDTARVVRLRTQVLEQEEELRRLSDARFPRTRAGIAQRYDAAFESAWARAKQMLSKGSFEKSVSDHAKLAREDEDKVDESSDLAMRLAKQRVARAKNLEASIIADVTRAAGSGGAHQDVLDSVGSAAEKYDEQVTRTARRISANNGFQIHHLRYTDTIDSICEEHRVGEAPDASDIKKAGFQFVARLPQKYVAAGASESAATYVTEGVVAESEEEEQREFPAILSRSISKRNPVIMLRLGQKTLYVLLSDAVRGANEAVRTLDKEEAREKFARQLVYLSERALPALSEKSASVAPLRVDPEMPLIKQLSDRMAERAKSIADEKFRTGLRELAQSCEEHISKPFDPDADWIENPSLVRFLGMIIAVSRDAGRESEVEGLISQAFSGYPSIVTAARNKSSAISSRLGTLPTAVSARLTQEDARIIDAASDIIDSPNLRSLISAVVASLEMMAGARSSWEEVEKDAARTDGGMSLFDRRLIDTMIPVPRRSLLTPGASVTVRAPRRRLGDTGMYNMRYLGIGFNSLISQPATGVITAIKRANFVEIMHPMLEGLCDEAADAWTARVLRMITGSGDEGQRADSPAAKMRAAVRVESEVSITPSDKAIIRDSLRKGVRELFILPETQVRRQDVEGIRRAYKGFSEFLGKKYVLMHDASSLAAADSDADSVQMRVKDLVRVTQDAAARMMLDERGAPQLARLIPCTVALLRPGSATAEGKLLLSLLTPSKDKALRTMSAASYRDTVLGVRRGRTGRQPIFGYEIESISNAVKLLNDFVESLDRDTGTEPDNVAPMIERAKNVARRADKSLGDKVPQAKICDALGIPANSSTAAIAERCVYLRRRAALEISHLSDVKGKLTEMISGIIAERTRDKTLSGLKTLLGRYVSGNAAHDVDSLTERVSSAFAEWVDDVPIPDPVDIKTAASLAPESRSANNTLVNDGIPQMIDAFVADVVDVQLPIYKSAVSRSLMPYAPKETTERT